MDDSVTRSWRQPSFYSRAMGPTLKAAVEAQLNVDPDEQTNLFEELALMRVYAGNFVKIYNAAVEANSPDKILMAGESMREALEAVASMCEKANKIREKQKDRLSLYDLAHVIDQIVNLHSETARSYGGNSIMEMAAQFEKNVREQLVLPNTSAIGTSMHPDETAALFDDSIPRLDEDDALNDALVDQMRQTNHSMLIMEE